LLFPLTPGAPSENIANLLSALLSGGRQTDTSNNMALMVLAGIQAYVYTGNPFDAALVWEPSRIAHRLIQVNQGDAQKAYDQVIADAKMAEESKDEPAALIAVEAAKILLQHVHDDSVKWNPVNKVVMSHRSGIIHGTRTNEERAKRSLPVPWHHSMAQKEIAEPPID
jgi:hypothetical protein